jgi:hypothetical protein
MKTKTFYTKFCLVQYSDRYEPIEWFSIPSNNYEMTARSHPQLSKGDRILHDEIVEFTVNKKNEYEAH